MVDVFLGMSPYRRKSLLNSRPLIFLMRWGLRRASRVLRADGGVSAAVSASGSGMTCILGDLSLSGVTLRGAGGVRRISEVSIGAARLGCNAAAPIGGLLLVGRAVLVEIGRLRPLRRNGGGVFVAGASGGGGQMDSFSFKRGDTTLGVGCVGGDGSFGVVVWVAKISTSWRSASNWVSLTGASGDDGCGCWRKDVRSLAASMAASADDMVGME